MTNSGVNSLPPHATANVAAATASQRLALPAETPLGAGRVVVAVTSPAFH
jgi:hypothetical protein